MDIKIVVNIGLTPSLKEYCENKIFGKIDKFENLIDTIKINMEVEKNTNKIVAIVLFNNDFSSRVNKIVVKDSDSMYNAIDILTDKLYNMINRYKNKIKQLQETNTQQTVITPLYYEENEEEFEISKIKRFELKPMFIEEAINEMNLLGHNFFVYFDAASENVCVVYKRKDGKYGLIEPIF